MSAGQVPCPRCGHGASRTLVTQKTRRRRECLACHHKFTTHERAATTAFKDAAEYPPVQPKTATTRRERKQRDEQIVAMFTQMRGERPRWPRAYIAALFGLTDSCVSLIARRCGVGRRTRQCRM